MSQDTYTRRIVRGRSGRLFGSKHEIETLFLESGILPFGFGVQSGTNEQDGELINAPVTIPEIRGFAALDPSIERIHKSEDDPTYSAENNNAMDVVRKGMLEVVPSTLLTRDGPIFLQHTSGASEPGELRDDNDTGNAIDISSIVSIFRGNENLGEVAVIDIHIT